MYDRFFDPGFSRRFIPYLTFLMTMVVFGIDAGIVGSIQASAQWQTFFGNPTGSTLGILNAIATLGEIVGNIIAPYFNDKWGRKTGIYIGSAIIFFATGLQAGAVNVKMYLAARFFVGVGILFCHNATPSYLAEFSTGKERPLVLGAYVPIYYVGAIVISWTCYSTVNWSSNWSWRAPCLVQLVPSIIQLILVNFVPESPRWLVVHSRNEEAMDVLVKYHGCGQRTEEIEQVFAEMVIESHEQDKMDKTSKWSDLFATKGMRIRVFIAAFAGISSQWSGNGLISYYITTILTSVGITSSKSQTLFNGLLNVWTFLFSLGCAPVSQKWGRRPIFLWGIGGMLVVWTIFTGLSASYAKTANAGVGSGVLAMIFLFNAFYGASWSTCFMYPVELFPSSIRAKGNAAQNSIDYLGLFMNIYANPIIMDLIAWKYYIVYIVILVIQLVVIYFTYVETNGLTVEEVCSYFDDEPRWFVGPQSKVLLREAAVKYREYAAAKAVEEGAVAAAGEHSSLDGKEKSDGGAAVAVLEASS